MSDSVDNQFTGLVAYGQHGLGYPVHHARQEATEEVAGQVNADQVNADNAVFGNGIAGQGDAGAAAAPVQPSRAAKDASHRPDDAKPFQCVSEMPLFL